jgi:hypothetical protein
MAHVQVSSWAQQLAPPQTRRSGPKFFSAQKHPWAFGLQPRTAHVHWSPAAGQPFGAQQTVSG